MQVREEHRADWTQAHTSARARTHARTHAHAETRKHMRTRAHMYACMQAATDAERRRQYWEGGATFVRIANAPITAFFKPMPVYMLVHARARAHAHKGASCREPAAVVGVPPPAAPSGLCEELHAMWDRLLDPSRAGRDTSAVVCHARDGARCCTIRAAYIDLVLVRTSPHACARTRARARARAHTHAWHGNTQVCASEQTRQTDCRPAGMVSTYGLTNTHARARAHARTHAHSLADISTGVMYHDY